VVVLKLARPGADRSALESLAREARLLATLRGCAVPELVGVGAFKGRPYIAQRWCSGAHATTVAREIREGADASARPALLGLCARVLDAYAGLHDRGVVHAQVHPRHLLVDGRGGVTIIDLGLARRQEDAGAPDPPPRGPVSVLTEPEFAVGWRRDGQAVAASERGEQYSLAALIYLLLTGRPYRDFDRFRSAVLRQIATEPPLAFAERGAEAWPAVEDVLGTALSKDPAERFASVASFAAALRAAPYPRDRRARPRRLVQQALVERLDEFLQLTGRDGPLLRDGLPAGPTCSVSYGAAGIALALSRLGQLRRDDRMVQLAADWVDRALADVEREDAFSNADVGATPNVLGPVSPYHAFSGIEYVRAVVAHATGDASRQQDATIAFIQRSRGTCANLDLTLGRSSVLLACALLHDLSRPEWPCTRLLREHGDRIQRELLEGLPTWSSVLLGIAHGPAGVDYAILSWACSRGLPPPPGIEQRLDQLADLAEPIGRGWRWPRRLPGEGLDEPEYWSGWCNGSAGHVFLWTLAHEVFGADRYADLAQRAAWNVWETPMLRTSSLCCGAGGQVYALLNLYRYTGERSWLERAAWLANASAACDSLAGDATGLWSLYKGHAGLALLAAEFAEPAKSAMPLFERQGSF
jgi:serine/threonine-protein kinase